MIKPKVPFEFDEKESLVRIPVNATYHSNMRSPSWAFGTRESADYAIRCLGSPAEEDHRIGRKILERLLALQTTDPTDLHYGIWGWYAEEPPREMSPADWNWADFIGIRLLQILHDYSDRLSSDLAQRTRMAAGHAAWAIFRRNVGPGYTNICAMGAVVCLVAGEMFADARLFDYGLRRLRNLRSAFEFHGGFAEYNSPTYTIVLIEELERLLHLAKCPEACDHAIDLLSFVWQLIAEQFHPGTGQWGGPQSRSYQDWLDVEKVKFLEARLGEPLAVQPLIANADDHVEMGFPYSCPESIRGRFFQLPDASGQHRHIWTKQTNWIPDKISTTWFSGEATLGSMNEECMWDQRRVVLGYWVSPRQAFSRVRLRVLHNGHDFVSARVRNIQDNSRILTGFNFAAGEGDYHPNLDRPPSGTFLTWDLRIRYEVEGPEAEVRELAADLFELSAGSFKIILRTGSLRFDGKIVDGWKMDHEGALVWLEGVFYSGPERPFNPQTFGECTTAVALELLPIGQELSQAPMEEAECGDERVFRCHLKPVMEVRIPRSAPQFV